MINGKYCIAGVCLAVVSHTVCADSLSEQRQRYDKIRQAWDHQQRDVVAQLMPTLKEYPLYPYLEYRQLAQDLSQDTPLAINHFLQTYPTLPSALSLKNRFINELARRKDWQGLLRFSASPPAPVLAQCHWYYANYATGTQQIAWQGAKKLWITGKPLPSGCDDLFNAWQASGQFDSQYILQRILLAVKAGNTSLTQHLIRLLSDDYTTLANALSRLQQSPQNLPKFAGAVSATEFSQQITLSGFRRLAKKDPQSAWTMIPQLVTAQKMDRDDTQQLKEAVAWQLMGGDVATVQQRWRDTVIMDSESPDLIERRLRLALSQNDRHGLNTWIARLPVEAKQKDEWQYWQADLLRERGRTDEANQILHQLAQSRGYYPMMAAQRMGSDYSLKIDKTPEVDPVLIQGSEIARVREFMYWGLNNVARSEWANLLQSKSRQQQQMLASYAHSQQWWDLGVQATITAKMWDYLKERFPLAWQSQYQHYATGKAIPISFAMAISRQESGLNPKITSPAGASGLMQIMPATARHTATRYRISDYTHSSQLSDPETNINIGMQYLDDVYRQFDNNRILAAAAYNAGPAQVNRWLISSHGTLNAAAFIETIPFSETRNYVKNVLAYDVYYRYFMGQQDKILQDREWNRHY